jgi:hypothetical protein
MVRPEYGEDQMQPAIESMLDIDRNVFAPLLKRAIKARGLSYQRAAELVRDRLPADSKLSHVSIWHYASARATPRRIEVFRALCDVFDINYEFGQRALSSDTGTPPSSAALTDMLHSSGSDARLLLKDSGGGIAFVRFEAEIEWEKALQIAKILRKDARGSDLAA